MLFSLFPSTLLFSKAFASILLSFDALSFIIFLLLFFKISSGLLLSKLCFVLASTFSVFNDTSPVPIITLFIPGNNAFSSFDTLSKLASSNAVLLEVEFSLVV